MRSFRLNQKFGLVIAPFRAFLHNRVSSVKRRNLEFRECAIQPKAHDLFCVHKLSHQAFMAKLVEVALSYIYSGSLPEILFWIFDSTHTEKPHSKKVAGLKWFHRTKKVDGRAKNLKGHCYVFAAPLYRHTTGKMIKLGQRSDRRAALCQRSDDPTIGH